MTTPCFSAAIACVVMSLLVQACASARRPAAAQPPNLFELGYEALATNVALNTKQDSSPICDRISPAARLDRYLLRSYCLMAVAQNADRVDLCARVLPRQPDGTGVSRQECETDLVRRVGAPGQATAAALLYAMGYAEDDIRREYLQHPDVPRFEEFLGNIYDLERIARLPDFSNGDEAARRQVAVTLPGCRGGDESLACALIACAFIRDLRTTNTCLLRVQDTFNRPLQVNKFRR